MMEAAGTTWWGGPAVQSAISPLSKLLGFPLTNRKHSTSQFLIDNFGACLMRRPLQQFTAQAGQTPISNRQSPQLEINLSHRKQRTENFLIAKFGAHSLRRPPQRLLAEADRTCNFESLTSSSNRHTRELESGVSHRKQRIGPLSNRHKIAFCNSGASGRSDQLCLTSNVKRLTSKTLLANEFHFRRLSRQPLFHHSGDAMTTFVADHPWQCDNCAGNSERGRHTSSLSVWGNETWH
jgi:hypothetical protein